MYDNIGGKIKGLVKAVFYFITGISVFLGISLVLSAASNVAIILGVLLIFLIPALTWLGTLLLYGFGEIVDKLCEIERNTRGKAKESEEYIK